MIRIPYKLIEFRDTLGYLNFNYTIIVNKKHCAQYTIQNFTLFTQMMSGFVLNIIQAFKISISLNLVYSPVTVYAKSALIKSLIHPLKSLTQSSTHITL